MAFQNLSTVLEDLTSRFIINIPEEELASIERVIFQIEQAHWFYEDFVRGTNLKLPSTSLKNFSLLLFQSCVLLRHWVAEHERAFTTFMEYKVKVPVCGAIILNPDLTKVLLVRGWKSNATWGFPKGKINQQEKQTSCAIREVFEEIGFDCSPYLRENEYLERKIHDQNVRLYMISGINESEEFITQTRKEIGDIKWHAINSLPGYQKGSEEADATITKNKKYKFYMVTPFMSAMKKWIGKFKDARKRGSERNKAGLKVVDTPEYVSREEFLISNDQSFGFGNDYNTAMVPENQRVEMEESLRNLLRMNDHAVFNRGMNPVMNGVNSIANVIPYHQQQYHPNIYVHPESQPQYYASHNVMQNVYQAHVPTHNGYPNSYTYPPSKEFQQDGMMLEPTYSERKGPQSDLEQEVQGDYSTDRLVPPREDTVEKNALVDLLLTGSKTEEVIKKPAEEKSLVVGANEMAPKNTEKKELLDILLPAKSASAKDIETPSLVNLLVTERFNNPKKILSRPKDIQAKTNVKAEKKSPKKEKTTSGPEFGKVQILKRPNEFKIPGDNATLVKSSLVSTTNHIISDQSVLQGVIHGDLESPVNSQEEKPPVFKLKSSSKNDKPKKLITSNSPISDPKSPDPGLEMALNGMGTLVTPHTPIDKGLSSALSGLPGPSPLVKEKQSLLDILQGVPQPPVHSRVDESSEIRSLRESRESIQSIDFESNTAERNGKLTQQEHKHDLLSLLLGSGSATESSDVPSPGSLSKFTSQQNSLLDILKGIPSPPKNDE